MSTNAKINGSLGSSLILTISLILSAATLAADKVEIFACEPEWAALAKEIGGNKIKTFTATHARQNPHFIRARPSLVAKARRADLLFCSGAGLEAGWLPILLKKGSSRIQPGQDGYLMASEFVSVLEIPEILDRSLGDIHPEGNPHVHLNPHNISLIAIELTARLANIDRANRLYYEERLEAFSSQWDSAIKNWEEKFNHLKGQMVIYHHKSFSYLIDWLEMKSIGSIEPKPGLPPTTKHLQNLLTTVRDQPSSIIFITPYDSDTGARWLGEKTSKTVITLPYTIGGDNQSEDLYTLFDHTLKLLDEHVAHR